MKQMMTLLKVVNLPQREVITEGWPRESPTQPLHSCQHRRQFCAVDCMSTHYADMTSNRIGNTWKAYVDHAKLMI